MNKKWRGGGDFLSSKSRLSSKKRDAREIFPISETIFLKKCKQDKMKFFER
jgi:hypothetical protein